MIIAATAILVWFVSHSSNLDTMAEGGIVVVATDQTTTAKVRDRSSEKRPILPPMSPDPLAATLSGASSDARMMHEQLGVQVRDDASARAEQAIRSAFLDESPIGQRAQSLQVKCVITLCEIAGKVADTSDHVQQGLADRALTGALPQLGFSPGPVALTTDAGQTTFVFYVNRET